MLLGLKAVEKMKQMVLVSSWACPTAVAHLDRSASVQSPGRIMWVRNLRTAARPGGSMLPWLERAHSPLSKQQSGAGTQQDAFHSSFIEHTCDVHRQLWQYWMSVHSAESHPQCPSHGSVDRLEHVLSCVCRCRTRCCAPTSGRGACSGTATPSWRTPSSTLRRRRSCGPGCPRRSASSMRSSLHTPRYSASCARQAPFTLRS